MRKRSICTFLSLFELVFGFSEEALGIEFDRPHLGVQKRFWRKSGVRMVARRWRGGSQVMRVPLKSPVTAVITVSRDRSYLSPEASLFARFYTTHQRRIERRHILWDSTSHRTGGHAEIRSWRILHDGRMLKIYRRLISLKDNMVRLIKSSREAPVDHHPPILSLYCTYLYCVRFKFHWILRRLA